MTEQEELALKQQAELKAKQTGKNPNPNPPLPEAEKPGTGANAPVQNKKQAPASATEPEPAMALEEQQYLRQHDRHAFLKAMLRGEEYMVPESEKNDVAVILFKDEFDSKTGLPRFKPMLQFFEGRTAWPNWIGDEDRDNAQGFKVLRILYQPPGSKQLPQRLRYSRDLDFWGQN